MVKPFRSGSEWPKLYLLALIKKFCFAIERVADSTISKHFLKINFSQTAETKALVFNFSWHGKVSESVNDWWD